MHRWISAWTAQGRCLESRRLLAITEVDDDGGITNYSVRIGLHELLWRHFPDQEWTKVSAGRYDVFDQRGTPIGLVRITAHDPLDQSATRRHENGSSAALPTT